MKYFTTLLLIISFASQNTYAIEEDNHNQFVTVTTYTTKDGLPSNNIQDIVQDETGFIWLGTQEGLSRFDSSSFVNFTKDKSDKYSLPDILVEDLVLMPDGELWMSIYEIGITVFDKFTHKSQSVKNTDSSLFQLPNSNLYGIAKDNNNNIWFSLYGVGIYQWIVSENKFIKHLSSDENAWLTSTQTFEIMVDSKNRLWVCTIDSKVYYYDINTGNSRFFNFSSDENDPLSSPIYGFAESPNGEIYAGGFSGVFKFDEKSELFNTVVSKSHLASYYDGERTSVRRLMVDSQDNLWIGTTKSLLQYSQDKLKKIQFYENGKALESFKLTIHSIIEGSDGNIWIGTEGLGLVKIAADWNRYKIYISQDKGPIDIRGAYQFEDNIWLIHTSAKLDLLEYVDGNIKLKTSLIPKINSDDIRIDSVYQEKPDVLWISSVNGINKVDTKTGASSFVVNKLGRKLGNILLFHKARDGNFYFNFFGKNEIGYFNENEMTAHVIKNTDTNSFKGKLVNQISEGLDGDIWFATDYGIESLNIVDQKFYNIYKSPSKLTISNLYFAENAKDVWMIADGGLYLLHWDGKKLHLQENKYQHILPLVKFGQIKRLKDDNLLITTEDHGLVEINVKTLSYKVYTKENGLPSNVIYDVLFPNNIPMVITELGVALYNDEYKAADLSPPNIVFDKIKLGEKLLKPGIKSLVLEHDYSALNFEISLLSYANSSMFEFEYMMQGASDEWVNTGSDNKYSFLNLSAGDYSFKIKGRSNFGKWSDIQVFSFKVKPPPWNTWWAYLLYTIGLLCLFWLILYLYKRKIIYEFEISKQLTQNHLANAASKAKSDFLARMSHEVRTPLNGVLGMGELMQDTILDEEQQIYADSIIASGKHLLDIINDILDLSKIEAGKLELDHQPFDLLQLVDEVVGTFTSQTKHKQLLFTCNFDSDINTKRVGDIIRVKQILFNLLGNAFKFTKQGEIRLIICNSSKGSKYISFRVEDTGIGVDEVMINDLFKPFVQADSAVTRKFGGTGLGLAIVKQLAEKMQGDIAVDGELNKGSIFSVNLSLDIDVNQNEIINQTATESKVCLIIDQDHMKESVVQYLNRLNIQFTNVVEQNTSCLFIDVLNGINQKHQQEINKALLNKVAIYLIGYNDHIIDDNTLLNHPQIKCLPPPVTYKNIKQACFSEHSIEVSKGIDFKLSQSQKYKLNILMVEDHSINQQVGMEMLEKMNHMVDIVDNAEEALNMLAHTQYDLILIDYHLPGMDGLTMIKEWKNRNKIPIIVITADLTDSLYHQCHGLGLDNIVAKPFSRRNLVEAINKALN